MFETNANSRRSIENNSSTQQQGRSDNMHENDKEYQGLWTNTSTR